MLLHILLFSRETGYYTPVIPVFPLYQQYLLLTYVTKLITLYYNFLNVVPTQIYLW